MKINFSPKTITKMENTALKLCKCAIKKRLKKPKNQNC